MIYFRLFLLFIFLFDLSYADSIGHLFEKGNESAVIKITDQNNEKIPIDSICLVFPDCDKITQLNPPNEGPWSENRMAIKKDGYFIYDLKQDFCVVIFSNSIRYSSGVISRCPGHEIYTLKIENNQLVDHSTFFHNDWYIYFTSLFVTLVIESLIGLIFLSTQKKSTYLITFLLVNILTHFNAWFIYSHSKEEIHVFFLEMAIILIESFYWILFLKSSFVKAIKISTFLNLSSWIIGAIITSLI